MPTDRHVPDYSSGGDEDEERNPQDADPIEREPSFASAGTVGMVLFLAALGMLFTASLVAFVFIRYGSKSPPAGAIHRPNELWRSTLLVICVSIALGVATRQLREGRHRASRNSLTASLCAPVKRRGDANPAAAGAWSNHDAMSVGVSRKSMTPVACEYHVFANSTGNASPRIGKFVASATRTVTARHPLIRQCASYVSRPSGRVSTPRPHPAPVAEGSSRQPVDPRNHRGR